MPDYTFSRFEHLKSRKLIDELFTDGSSLVSAPVRLLWKSTEADIPSRVQAGFTVPKKQFKRAVDRNLLKRRMREAYRLNKKIIFDNLTVKDKPLVLMFVYTAKTIAEYKAIEKGIIVTLQLLAKSISNKASV
jgi:ribonuclease P protein component